MSKQHGPAATIAGWVGLVLLLFPLYWYAASGLLAPLWAVIALLVLWAAALVLGLFIRGRRPWLVLILAPALMIIWFLVMYAGETFLGWTP
jgi:hypothetical protein